MNTDCEIKICLAFKQEKWETSAKRKLACKTACLWTSGDS